MTEPRLEVPAPGAELAVPLEDGETLRLRVYRNPGRPVLVLSHGNGFAIDAYAPFWSPLRADFELWLFDLRHHGHNAPQDPAKTGIERYAGDLARVYATIRSKIGGRPLIGVFHSLSAIASLVHAASSRAPPDALVLLDPPIQPPAGHPLADRARAFELKLADWSAGRPDRFGAPDELAARFAGSRSLSGWVPGAHALMARAILRKIAPGDWVLCCPRAVEAQNYRDNADLTSWTLFEAIDIPTAIVGGDPEHGAGQPPARVCQDVSRSFPVGYRCVPKTTHMLQIERPDLCRAAMRELLACAGAGPALWRSFL